MKTRRSPFAPTLSVAEGILETRVVMSGSTLHHGAADVAAQGRTATTLSATAGTLGQPITFNVSVRAAASAGSPTGTVNLLDHGQVIETLTLAPTTSTNPNFATSGASVTLTPQAGGSAYYFGRHAITAQFVPSGSFSQSIGKSVFTVSEPGYTTLSDGVQTATIAPGSGPGIQAGQTANMLYTGYLAKNGHIFDDSAEHGGTPFSFTVGAGQVIPGFDAGTVGMKVGETRILRIPPAAGYGGTANGPIPAHSTLIFVLTLESIS